MRRPIAGAVAAASAFTLIGCAAPETTGSTPIPFETSGPSGSLTGTRLLAEAGTCYEGNRPSTVTIDTAQLTHLLAEYRYGTLPDPVLLYAGSYPSAAVAKVTLGPDGLQYTDETGGRLSEFVDAERLLGALVCSKELLAAALQEEGELHVRAFKERNGDEYNRSGLDDFVYNPDSSTIYGFLPAGQVIEQETLLVQYRHELLHAALNKGGWSANLQPEQRQIVERACTIIRQSAVRQAAQHAGNIIQNLRTLQSQIEPQYRGAFDTVIQAIQQGTFDQLPTEDRRDGLVSACHVQSPMHAVRQVVLANGGDAQAYAEAVRALDYTVAAGVHDAWYDIIEELTIYSLFKEGNIMGGGLSNNEFGHPQDNSDELLATFLNAILSFPDRATSISAQLTAEERHAVLDIAQAAIVTIKHNYPNDTVLAEWLDARYALFVSKFQTQG